MQNEQPAILTKDLGITFGNEQEVKTEALRDIDLTVKQHEFVSIIGPSGSGKTTLLRIVADLLKPTTGNIEIYGSTPRQARLSNMFSIVFQEAALLEWRTALDNIALPLELKGVDKRERLKVANEMLKLVKLEGFANHYPRQLSGGMRQRVAIARALSINPPLLLMDEPFAALDQITRHRMNFELLRIWRHSRPTVFFITHNIREAILLSDRVIVLSTQPGRIFKIFDIDIPRPRSIETTMTDEFNRYHVLGERTLEETIYHEEE